MTCAACATRIEKGLARMEGVLRSNVNYALERSTIIYNPSILARHDFEQKIAKLGYRALTEEEEQGKEDINVHFILITCFT